MPSSPEHQLTVTALVAVAGSVLGGFLGLGAAFLWTEVRDITNEPWLFLMALGILVGLIAGFGLSTWISLRVFHRRHAALTALLGAAVYVMIGTLLIALTQVLAHHGVTLPRSFVVWLAAINAISAGLAVVAAWFLVRSRGDSGPAG